MTDARDALSGLNDAIDLYWNEGRTDGQVKNICYWQMKAKEALAATVLSTSQPATPELAPCPFCGARDAFAEREDFTSAYVTCNHCSARGPVECQEGDDEETPGKSAAEVSWNTRINRAALAATPAVGGEREALRHAEVRFQCLADHFKEVGDEALWAMSEVDAERMGKALAATPAVGGETIVNCVRFVKWALQEGPWSGGDLDGGGIQDKAESLGLIIPVPYDPEKHGAYNDYGCDAGDPWFEFSPGLNAAAPPASPLRGNVCCYCDAPLSCARCGMEQPDASASPPEQPAAAPKETT